MMENQLMSHGVVEALQGLRIENVQMIQQLENFQQENRELKIANAQLINRLVEMAESNKNLQCRIVEMETESGIFPREQAEELYRQTEIYRQKK